MLIGLPTIPVMLMLGRLIRWEDALLKFWRKHSTKLPLFNLILPNCKKNKRKTTNKLHNPFHTTKLAKKFTIFIWIKRRIRNYSVLLDRAGKKNLNFKRFLRRCVPFKHKNKIKKKLNKFKFIQHSIYRFLHFLSSTELSTYNWRYITEDA